MLIVMDGNVAASTPPSTPPNKRRRISAPRATRFPSFQEEPHTSPSKIGELGLHVLLSPTNHDPRQERMISFGRVLTLGEQTQKAEIKVEGRLRISSRPLEQNAKSSSKVERETRPKAKVKGEEPMEYWDRSRESMYVSAFNTAVDTVIEREGHLFSAEEMKIIDVYRNLPCRRPSVLANVRREYVSLRPPIPTKKFAMVSSP